MNFKTWPLHYQVDPNGATTLLLLPPPESCTSLAEDPLSGGTLRATIATGWGL